MEDAYAKVQKQLEPCEPPFSFFRLVDELWHGESNPSPLRRLCTLMRKMNVKSLVSEELELNEELLEEQDLAARQYDQDVGLTATRLTFFRLCPSSLRWCDNTLLDIHLLGYAVVVTLMLPNDKRWTYLLEAVVRPPSILVGDKDRMFIEPVTNYYMHNTRNFKTTIGVEGDSRTFDLTGSFFAQQSTVTHSCAHAALRMAINSSPTFMDKKLTNKRINDILGSEKHDGLYNQEIIKVIHQLGGGTISVDFTKNIAEYDQFIYPFIESSRPVILGVEYWNSDEEKMVGHVVSVLGHTLNSDRWEPEARIGYGDIAKKPYIPATGWVGHYIINDDNLGMYLTLPSDMLRNHPSEPPQENPNLHATMAIAIVPKDVRITGWLAEQIAMRKIQGHIRDVFVSFPFVWLKRLVEQPKYIVSRTLLQTKESYIEHIKSLSNDRLIDLTSEIQQQLNHLPNYVWVSEITLPELYTGNKHKVGDIVIRADAEAIRKLIMGESVDTELIRLPGIMYFESKERGFFCDSDRHVPLIRQEKTIPMLEW